MLARSTRSVFITPSFVADLTIASISRPDSFFLTALPTLEIITSIASLGSSPKFKTTPVSAARAAMRSSAASPADTSASCTTGADELTASPRRSEPLPRTPPANVPTVAAVPSSERFIPSCISASTATCCLK